ncbi:MAG: NAD+ synthase [Rhodospirillales bacterium]|nr:NAD+ synthase [Rhodospirillales bacterium]MBO6788493.1 NAD+ synthase [Rhodospirillales bacterium]
MTDRLLIAVAQINPTVGDVAGNVALIEKFAADAAGLGADLMVATELAISGYPPEDLVLKEAFQDRIEQAVTDLASRLKQNGAPAVLLGAPWRVEGKLYNAALLLDDGAVKHARLKHELPNYGVFDEKRVFAPGPLPGPIPFRDVRLGVMICEDLWFPDVAECLQESGAEFLISLNGSPFDVNKVDVRLNTALERVTETGLASLYVNQVCGQDELVFDGGSFVVNPDYKMVMRAPFWQESLMLTEWTRTADGWFCAETDVQPSLSEEENVYQAMTLGLRDYVTKNGFPGVVIGLSGGIDSALSAAVAVDALGADKVLAVMMPSPYTSEESLEDAAACAEMLGVRLENINIGPAMSAFDQMLAPVFEGRDPDITEENIQARARGLLLMGISNKLGHMLLTTGNKSEMSVGYATLYGDMCGGYSVLKDVYKTAVFKLSHWRNAHLPPDCLGPEGMVIPERIITKPPSAELRPDQKDEDSLPPYDELDGILGALIEDEKSVDDVVSLGYDIDTVKRIWKLLDRAEYKRRQAPPGVKITQRAFGKDRRYPITNGFTKQI